MILILGGTKMARLLAKKLSQKYNVIYSIKGSTQAVKLPKNCELVTGGFGGVLGMSDFFNSHNINICIDATHPFAQNISANAIAACKQTGIDIIQYARQNWSVEGADEFSTETELINALPYDAIILLTIGGQNILPFLKLEQPVFARMIEPPKLDGQSIAPNFELIFSRPPYALIEEIELLAKHKITHLVCKNSGGEKVVAKIGAARKLGVKIFMLKQPKSPHETQLFRVQQVEDYLYRRGLSSPS